MTEEEAMTAAWGEEGITDDPGPFAVNPMLQHAFKRGFRAGLAHARQWRELTADPKTWPEEGQLVLLRDRVFHEAAHWMAMYQPHFSHWLPIPDDPPEPPR